MDKADIVVIDYGMGNLLSVCRAFEYLGASVCITSDPNIILRSGKVVLPGVGSFPEAMKELQELGLISVIKQVAQNGTMLLGICLGMQILFESSQEFGGSIGLGLLPGDVIPIPLCMQNGSPLKIPHIGWRQLHLSSQDSLLASKFSDVLSNKSFYFVHSFMAQPKSGQFNIANCLYGDVVVPAVVGRDNLIGCQFHPEKSGADGLEVLRRFLEI